MGFALGGELGARAAVAGGERVIKPMLVLAVVELEFVLVLELLLELVVVDVFVLPRKVV